MLDWEGRAAVEDCHLAVPYQLVHCNGALSAGDKNAGNLLVQGDNLAALKALLPYYGGKVKCVYIDPPYNTGNGGWVYSDRMDSPEISRWLGKTVGGEAEDLVRHDKWLCMMHPRLALLREFLRPDGAIFVSIDDNEVHHLRVLMDGIFGGNNFRNEIVVRRYNKNISRQFMAAGMQSLAIGFERILVYAKSGDCAFNPVYRAASEQRRESGYWKGFWNAADRPTMRYPLLGVHPDSGQWKWERERAERAVKNYREYESKNSKMSLEEFWRKTDGEKEFIRRRKELSRGRNRGVEHWIPPSEGILLSSDWTDLLASDRSLEEYGVAFNSPKSAKLIRRVLEMATSGDDLVLDSFAGSGTTGHAVLALNKEGGNRQFILVEMEKDICEKITARRLRKVIGKDDDGLGGGFRYCTLGRELFDEYGQIASEVKFADLAAHIFFSETGVPIPKKAGGKSPLLGEFNGKAVYLLFQGAEDGKVLDPMTLRSLPQPKGKVSERVVYGESCALTKRRLAREGIVFRKIPWEVQGK